MKMTQKTTLAQPGVPAPGAVVADWCTEQLLDRAREYLRTGGSQARRRIVQTALGLAKILGEEAL